jgi:hypothetical protein
MVPGTGSAGADRDEDVRPAPAKIDAGTAGKGIAAPAR